MANDQQQIDGDVLITGSLNVLEGINDTDLSEVQATAEMTNSVSEVLDTDVTSLLADLADLESDGKLTPSEKLVVEREWTNIEGEYPKVLDQAAAADLGVGDTAYDDYLTDYAALDTYLTPLLSDLTTTSTITGTTLRTTFQTYFEQRGILFDAIQDENQLAEQVPPDPIAYWSFDDEAVGQSAAASDTIGDNSGNSINGTVAGTPDYVTGKAGSALHFDGSTDYITASAPISDLFGAWSVSVWANPDVTSQGDTFARYFEMGDSVAAQGLLRLLVDTSSPNEWYIDWRNEANTLIGGGTKWAAVAAGVWAHIVITYDGSGTLISYLNGVQVASETVTESGTCTPDRMTVASDYAYNNKWDGKVDEVGVWNSALTVQEIRWLYKHPGLISGVTVTTSRLRELAVTTSKIALLAVDTAQIARSAVDATKVDVPNFEVNPGDESLVAAWSFEEQAIGTAANSSVTIKDTSGNSHDGTVEGAPAYVSGKSGAALHFDETVDADKIIVPNHADFNITGDFSVSIWLYADDASANSEDFFTKRDSGNDTGAIIGRRTTSSKIDFYMRNAADDGWNVITSAAATANAKWVHVVLMQSSDVLYMYINGVVEADTEACTTNLTGTQKIRIGQSDTGNRSWDGGIDEVRFYSKALTAAEVQWLYHNPGSLGIRAEPIDPGEENLVAHWSFEDKPVGQSAAADEEIMDVSGNGHVGTVEGAPAYKAGKTGAALHFDDSSDADKIIVQNHADFNITGDFSVSLWLNSDNGSGNSEDFFTKRGSDSTKAIILRRNTSSKIDFYMRNVGDTGWNLITSAAATGNSTWVHIVFMQSSDVLYMWINGVVEADTEACTTDLTGTQNIRIGQSNTGNRSFDGKMDEIRFYSKALTAAEVQFLYLNPGGAGITGVNRHRVGAAELTAKHLRFGGADIITEKGTEIVATDELWQMDFAGRSNLGRFPEEKVFVPVPDKIYDHDNVGYDNAYAKGWESDSWYTPVMGFWAEGENLVTDPEDLTTANWTGVNVTASLTDEYFDGKRWNKVNVDSTSTAYIRRDVSITGSDNCVRVLLKKGVGTESRVALYDFGGANNIGYVAVNWSAYNATGNDGAVVYEAVWHKSQDILELAFKQGTGTISGTPAVLIYPDVIEAVNDYVYTTAVQVEANPWPTPYMPTERSECSLVYRYTWATSGYVDVWVRPRFQFDGTSPDPDHIILTDNRVEGGVVYETISLEYNKSAGTERFEFIVTGASNTVILTAGCNNSGVWAAGNVFASNTYLHAWIHLECYWHETGTLEFKVNGVSIDTDTTNPGTLTFNNRLQIGKLGLHGGITSRHWNGEIADLRIGSTSAGTHGTDDKPWVDGNSMPNFSNSLTLDRYGIKINRGDLSMLDVKNRLIDIGSQGIRARDRGGAIIHDVLDKPVISPAQYFGHYYPVYGLDPGQEAFNLSDTYTGTDTDTFLTGETTGSGDDISAYIPAGSHPYAAMVTFRYRGWSNGKYDVAMHINISVAAYTDTAKDDSITVINLSRVRTSIDGNEMLNYSETGAVPIYWASGVPYIYWAFWADHNDMLSGNAETRAYVYMRVVGVFA